MPYRVTNMKCRKTDFQSLQAAAGVLRLVVPVVCDVHVHRATAELAVEKVLEKMEIPQECCGKVSMERQANMLCTMFSHLRRSRKNLLLNPRRVPKTTRRASVGKIKLTSDILEIAMWMKHVRSHGSNNTKTAKVTETQGGDVRGGQIKSKWAKPNIVNKLRVSAKDFD